MTISPQTSRYFNTPESAFASTARQSAPALGQPRESQFLGLLSGLGAIVWEADPVTHATTFISPQVEEILGYPVSAWLADSDFWTRHLHPEDRERAVAHFRQVAAEGGDHMIEYRIIAANGGTVWIRDLIHVVSDWQGKPRGLYGVMVDITPRVEEAQPAPSVAVRIERDALPAVEEHLDQLPLVDLNQELRGVEDTLRRLLGDPIALVLQLEAPTATVRIERIQLERMLVDLALRARDSMIQGGSFKLRTSLGGHPGSRRLILSALDNGLNLDAVLRARVFESLFTQAPARKSASVSMNAVAEIVEDAGGTIVVQDVPGGGTQIDVSFPLVEGDDVEPTRGRAHLSLAR